MARIRKFKIKVEPKTSESWKSIFDDWSMMMNYIYGKNNNGMYGEEGALSWDDNNPAEWMEPYNDAVMQAWISYDMAAPVRWEDLLEQEALLRK